MFFNKLPMKKLTEETLKYKPSNSNYILLCVNIFMIRMYKTESTVNIVLPQQNNIKTAKNIKMQTLLKLKIDVVYQIGRVNELAN